MEFCWKVAGFSGGRCLESDDEDDGRQVVGLVWSRVGLRVKMMTVTIASSC